MWRDVPVAPLLATIAVQTLCTMAVYSIPAVAPAMARDLGIPSEFSGLFVAGAYGFGIISALASPDFVHRYGAVRVCQVALLCSGIMLATASSGTVAALALAVLLLGFGYGANAPASTHLLAPRTPRAVFNLVMSIRQIGVPLGGVLAALILPPLTVWFGWRIALLAELPVMLFLIALMERPRDRWDEDRKPDHRVLGRNVLAPFRMLRDDKRLRDLSIASFCYTGVSLSFVAYTTTHLTHHAGFTLVRAGQVLALYQIAGTLSRPVWGWIADRFLTPGQTLGMHGFGMTVALVLVGQITPSWPMPVVLLLAILGGSTAGGYTGIAYAEYARLGGARRTEATGAGTAIMFSAVPVIPPIIGGLALVLGGYSLPYLALACVAAPVAILMWRQPAPAH